MIKFAITLLVVAVLLFVLRAGARGGRRERAPLRGRARWLPWATLLAALSLIAGFGLLWRALFVDV